MVNVGEGRIDVDKSGVDRLDFPVSPIRFPTPSIRPAKRLEATQVRLHSSGKLVTAHGVLLPSSPSAADSPRRGDANCLDNAYWLRPNHMLDDDNNKLKLTTHGCVIVCVVLRRGSKDGGSWRWETTDQLVGVKVSSLRRVMNAYEHDRSSRSRRGTLGATTRRGSSKSPTSSSMSSLTSISSSSLSSDLASSDPLKEAAALQFLGNYHPHILGCLDVLSDSENLYTVMPWCESGDLYERLIAPSNRSCRNLQGRRSGCVSEEQARTWFTQLLGGLSHLQNKGVCHRSLSLENLLVDADGNLKMIDFGMALRVPYTDTKNFNCISDVSEGSVRRLIVRDQHQRGGNLTYLAPEVLAGHDFDGFAVDLWSAAVILFVWLVGAAPFKVAHPSDLRYTRASSGNLAETVRGLDIALSADACDLLQRMLFEDPTKRLSLKQILQHKWVRGGAGRVPESHSVSAPAAVAASVSNMRISTPSSSPSRFPERKTFRIHPIATR